MARHAQGSQILETTAAATLGNRKDVVGLPEIALPRVLQQPLQSLRGFWEFPVGVAQGVQSFRGFQRFHAGEKCVAVDPADAADPALEGKDLCPQLVSEPPPLYPALVGAFPRTIRGAHSG
eukprot:CAMPEP_0201269220 /NCGR_PEP_ID=MMETSP0853-20130426/31864_1 /ASSEMBLY_ACC=CAM_ASM_000640 /TAXON_ID=183588 /ORGANISM="Pseudo-nitzschia fraudulenta, Strain WWA7" /LENGTH=120 /DNA_ID=CAMNT_0047575153 /DNA_START=691 /DNA_END=1053 /DNA_ORIENTATION=-